MGNNEEQLFTGQVSSLHCLFGSRNSQVTHIKSVNMDLDPRKHVSKKPTVSYKYVAMETTKLHLTAIMCDLKKPQTWGDHWNNMAPIYTVTQLRLAFRTSRAFPGELGKTVPRVAIEHLVN